MKGDKTLKNAKVVGIIPVRLGSSRLPKKVLLPLNEKPVLQHIVERMRKSKTIDSVVIATTTRQEDLEIVNFCNKLKCICFRGNDNNVIQRMINTSLLFEKEVIIVDTSQDCPLIDPHHIDIMISILRENNYDYISNVVQRSWPDGFDLQVYKRETLIKAKKLITNPVHFIHAGWNILNYGKDTFKIGSYPAPEEYHYPDWELCLDTKEDYKLLQIIFKKFQNKKKFSAEEVIDFLKQNPIFLEINKNVKRNNPDDG